MALIVHFIYYKELFVVLRNVCVYQPDYVLTLGTQINALLR